MGEVALECPAYGYRRVLAEMKRRGWQIGERRVRRWMREQGLSRPRQRAWKRTTDSNHAFAVYPNLAPALTLSAPDPLQQFGEGGAGLVHRRARGYLDGLQIPVACLAPPAEQDVQQLI